MKPINEGITSYLSNNSTSKGIGKETKKNIAEYEGDNETAEKKRETKTQSGFGRK